MRHGSRIDPPNRFESVRCEPDDEHWAWDEEYLRAASDRRIEYFSDSTRSIVSENDSPDIPFRYSVNPYRGCVHGCAYCYARPTHEYLGFNAGLDFETRIVVKPDAPRLFAAFLARDAWKPEPIAFSGVTDCFQPAERTFRLTRQCLAVALACRQPVSIITKNALVARDLDLLERLASERLVRVSLSLTTLDAELSRAMEGRTSIPSARLRTMRLLADSGVPVSVTVAPVIPGLNDSEMPAILEAAKAAGAISAGYTLLRLPQTVQPVFLEWLARTRPLGKDKILAGIRATRRGQLDCSAWGERLLGAGEIARQIHQLFQLCQRKHGLDRELPPLNCDLFRPPAAPSGQLRLFD